MTSEAWEKIKELFEAALEQEPEQRPTFLAEACGGDDFVRSEGDRLIREHEGAGSFTIKSGKDTAGLPPTVKATKNSLPANGIEKSIGEFRILRTIGRGGMGTVYEAYQESMRRKVALKVMDSGVIPSTNETARFEREAWIGGRLSHPNIVKVYARGEVDRIHYIAMELVEGESLAASIHQMRQSREQRPWLDSRWRAGHVRRMVSLFVGAADGLQHVHQHGIVHRDIKPANLLVNKDGSLLLLTHFGLAQDEGTSLLTRRGDFMGTISYMSPEQMLAQRVKVDHRSDIWSLGVSLYEAVTLQLPHSGDSAEAYISAVSMKQPLPARSRDPAVPRDLETVLIKCLERDPEQRYATAAELKQDLARFLGDQPVLARRPGVLLRTSRYAKRHRIQLGTIATTLLLAVIVLGFLLNWRQNQNEIERIRWTLEQIIINKDAKPEALQPDWSHLEDLLQREVRHKPQGELALLAQRAAVRATVELPSFGLLSKMPDLSVGAASVLDPGKDFLSIVDVEGALDDGPWKPIGSVAILKDEHHSGFRGSDKPLNQIFSEERLTVAVPHRLELRATLKFFDPSRLPLETRKKISALEDAWPVMRSAIPLFTEVRSMGTASITLFREYPEDFPRKMFTTGAMGSFESFFHLNRVRIVRANLPPVGNASGFMIDWPQTWMENGDERRGQKYCAPADRANRKGLVVGVELNGRMDSEMPFPIASEATLWSDRDSRPLLTFPFVFGLGKIGGGPFFAYSKEDGPETSLIYDFASANPNSLKTLGDAIEDRITSGHFDLVPSRSVALATHIWNRYWGGNVSIPVPLLEIITVQGKWVEVDGCR